MPKSATEVMQEVLLAAVTDAIVALKDASKGVPNILLRDLGAIHANTTFADLPPALQAAITASVRSGFNRLLKEGYSVSIGSGPGAAPTRPQTGGREDGRRPRPNGPRKPGGHRNTPRGSRPGGGKPPRKPQ
ncbi:hypothetical protein RCO27_04570 [Sphingosinicella sp. LHD-64]|uniref:hypothetical protein n=1 Tax=Sphingosinicella sp. LHD-64 TaxID=3072139 RepID=UPI00280C7DDD|nr:hypothetical protein [Sphingosinicella sp. LHD-64]MDQ8755495.1 hypothetical protein [Sphingosinicella sp. LHD-64]